MNRLTRTLFLNPVLAVLLMAGFMFLLMAGCMKNVTLRPGAVNQFDSVTYDTLITVQAALATARTQAPQFPTLIPQLNQAIAAYDAAQAAYKTYHTAATGGAATPAQQAALQTQITDLVSQVAKLETAFGSKLP